jgi:hypothetical protein
MVFHYFYINGINTPEGDRNNVTRGTYVFERAVVTQNLLDLTPDVPLRTQPPIGASPIKVANEVDVMEEETHNPSGKDVNHEKLWREQCEATFASGASSEEQTAADRLCDAAASIGAFVDNGMSPGDLLECFRQSLNVKSLAIFSVTSLGRLMTLVSLMNDAITKRPLADVEFTEKDPLVEKVAGRIVEIFKGEGGRSYQNDKINFFIVIGHSQGNFFVEGVANRLYSLEGDDGSYVFANRLGLVSLASPTAYETLPEPFREERIAHVTREDDMIKVVNATSALGKRPWPDEDIPPLWPWKPDALARTSDPSWVAPKFGMAPNNKFFNPEQDNALYTPLMNSHLVENYLTNPTATLPCIPLNLGFVASAELTRYCVGRSAAANLFGANGRASPVSPPVVDIVRNRLRDLKSQLIEKLMEDRDRSAL